MLVLMSMLTTPTYNCISCLVFCFALFLCLSRFINDHDLEFMSNYDHNLEQFLPKLTTVTDSQFAKFCVH